MIIIILLLLLPGTEINRQNQLLIFCVLMINTLKLSKNAEISSSTYLNPFSHVGILSTKNKKQPHQSLTCQRGTLSLHG